MIITYYVPGTIFCIDSHLTLIITSWNRNCFLAKGAEQLAWGPGAGKWLSWDLIPSTVNPDPAC